MGDSSYMTILGLGFILGLRHALDSDHLAAVSTVLAERPSWRASSLVGLSWGVGHTAVLLFVGTIVLMLRVPIPEPFAIAAEALVGVMLVVLGALLGAKLIRERWHFHHHDHDGTRHVHFHNHRHAEDHGHVHWWRESLRPLCIGMAHGLAGSAALLLLVVASANSVLDGLLYIAVFGCGSILGMMLIGLALSVPVVWSLRVGRPLFLAVQGMASVGSIALGSSIVYRIFLAESLL
ncbi:MAG TPA: sulfite exporter TauE/SafE family protein [Nitrospira sp.]|nr:sulfite exporter TauE/SafE family protein [Nitrospira sp.]